MFSRRSFMHGVNLLAVAGVGGELGSVSAQSTSVSFPPAEACDAHVHAIGELQRYPMSADRNYTPQSATVDQLIDVMDRMNINRVVIVEPSVYGYDHRATVDALQRLGKKRARAVIFADERASEHAFNALKELGVVGVRLPLSERAATTPAAATQQLRAMYRICEPRGWHIEIDAPPIAIAALHDELAASPVPIVLEYFGWVMAGTDQLGFTQILSLMRSGRVFVKLAQPYRISRQGPTYEDLRPLVRAYVAANSARVIWGSGWPHVRSRPDGVARGELLPHLQVDTPGLLDLLASWVPEGDLQRSILVDNPKSLFGFF